MVDTLDDAARNAIEQALFERRKIDAIKLYRDKTGSSLRDAKLAVDAIEAELRRSAPGRFRSGGCMPMVLLALGAGVIAWKLLV